MTIINNERLKVKQSNALIEAQYDLSETQLKLLLFMFSIARNDGKKSQLHKIYLKDVMNVMGQSNTIYKKAHDDMKKLQSLVVEVQRRKIQKYINNDGNTPIIDVDSIPIRKSNRPKNRKDNFPETIFFNYFHKSILKKDDKGLYILFQLHEDIIPFISEIPGGNFTEYELSEILNLNSRYSILVYQLMTRFKNMPKHTIRVQLEYLRFYLALEDKYLTFRDFEKRVLKKALNEINQNTDMQISYQKRGKRNESTITEIIFKFKYRTKEEWLNKWAGPYYRIVDYNTEDAINALTIDQLKTITKKCELLTSHVKHINAQQYLYHALKYLTSNIYKVKYPYAYIKDYIENDREYLLELIKETA